MKRYVFKVIRLHWARVFLPVSKIRCYGMTMVSDCRGLHRSAMWTQAANKSYVQQLFVYIQTFIFIHLCPVSVVCLGLFIISGLHHLYYKMLSFNHVLFLCHFQVQRLQMIFWSMPILFTFYAERGADVTHMSIVLAAVVHIKSNKESHLENNHVWSKNHLFPP